jgi:hypothetical protein
MSFGKKVLSVILCIVLMLGIAPLNGFIGIKFPKLHFPRVELPALSELFAPKAKAATIEGESGVFTYKLNEDTGEITITGCDKTVSGHLTVPSRINTYNVVKIDNAAFADCTQLTSIDLGSVSQLGLRIIAGCTNIKEITIPHTVNNCDSTNYSALNKGTLTGSCIETLHFEEGITEVFPGIAQDVTTLKEVSIPDTVKTIGASAFAGCVGIEEIELPDGIISIGNYAFSGCTSLTEIDLKSVQSLGTYLISGCTNIKEINIPASATDIKWDNVYNRGVLTGSSIEKLYFAEGTKTIGTKIAADCKTLKSVGIPNSAETIDASAFNGCEALEEINLKSVKVLGSRAFANCASLTSIDLKSVESLGIYLIAGCTNIKEIKIPASATDIKWDNVYNRGVLTGSSIEKLYFAEGTKTIATKIAADCKTLKIVCVPRSLEKICKSAFVACEAITDVYFAGSETEWAEIVKESYNDCLINAKIHYGYWPDTNIPANVSVFNDHSYLVIKNTLTWEEAQEKCIEMGGHLATVTSSDEQSFIANTLLSDITAECWIGGTDKDNEGEWSWVTNEKWSYTYWAPTEPKNSSWNYGRCPENYLVMRPRYSWKWDDACNQEEIDNGCFFICEWDSTGLVAPYWGDLNGDYKVNFSDMLIYNKIRTGRIEPTQEQRCFMDVDLNGLITVDNNPQQDSFETEEDFDAINENQLPADMIYMNKLRLGKINELPAYSLAEYELVFPIKTTYEVGEPFDPSGMKIIVTNKDNSSVRYELTENIEVSGFDSSSEGSKTVTASLRDMSFTFKVNIVNENEEPPVPTENIYNLGEETYNFKNYAYKDYTDSFCKIIGHRGGHCFGMAVTSSAYHLGLLNRTEIIGGNYNDPLYSFSCTPIVREPICHYQSIQGKTMKKAMVAGGYVDKHLTGISIGGVPGTDPAGDWKACVNYVKDHNYDNKGSLTVGVWYDKKDWLGDLGDFFFYSSHALNFLYYKEVDGMQRIYVYDNNFPDPNTEIYLYFEDGKIHENISWTGDGVPINIVGMDLMDVRKYFDEAKSFKLSNTVYGDISDISVSNSEIGLMRCDQESGGCAMFEVPDGTKEVVITPLVDYAEFEYMDQTYTFGKTDNNTYGVLTLATSDSAPETVEFEIKEAPGTSLSEAKIYVKSDEVYKNSKVTVKAKATGVPDGYVLAVYDGGKPVATGTNTSVTYEIPNLVASDKKLKVKIIDKDGNVQKDASGKDLSEIIEIKVKLGFFDLIIAFFKKLFGSNKVTVEPK